MKRRIIGGIMVCAVLAAGIFGVVKKQTYTDITSMENYLDTLQVALLPEQMVEDACKTIEESVPEAPIILKGRAIGEIEHLFYAGRQKIKITQVYKGEGLQADDEIYLNSIHWQVCLWDTPQTVERGFVNVMQEGKEYLVFLSGEIEDIYTDVPVYQIDDTELLMTPMFCYDDMEKTIVETSGETTYVPYSEVKNNEFFGISEYSHEVWGQLKQKMLAKYK